MEYLITFVITFVIIMLVLLFPVNLILEDFFPNGVGAEGESAVFVLEVIISFIVAIGYTMYVSREDW